MALGGQAWQMMGAMGAFMRAALGVTAQRVGPRSPPSSGPKPDLAGRPWTIPAEKLIACRWANLTSEP
jgi:hypothetical protein